MCGWALLHSCGHSTKFSDLIMAFSPHFVQHFVVIGFFVCYFRLFTKHIKKTNESKNTNDGLVAYGLEYEKKKRKKKQQHKDTK